MTSARSFLTLLLKSINKEENQKCPQENLRRNPGCSFCHFLVKSGYLSVPTSKSDLKCLQKYNFTQKDNVYTHKNPKSIEAKEISLVHGMQRFP